MNMIVKSALTSLALVLALPACAQQAASPAPAASDADPALWVVKDEDTTVYLFGTVHVLKPGMSWFDEAVKTAFDRSDTLVLEMVTPDEASAQQLAIARGLTQAGPSLTEQLPEAKRAAFAKAVADAGMPLAAFDRMRPWLAAIQLSMGPLTKLGYDATNGPETVLTAAAKAANKPVVGLESFEQQIDIFDTLSNPAQIAFLTQTVDDLPKAETQMSKMVDDWARGDPDQLAALLNDNLKDVPEVGEALLTRRNKAWAGWIADRMKQPGTVFVAVGAGHLAGAQSVQTQLQPYRITATRVRY